MPYIWNQNDWSWCQLAEIWVRSPPKKYFYYQKKHILDQCIHETVYFNFEQNFISFEYIYDASTYRIYVCLYHFTTLPHPHGHWQLQEIRGNLYSRYNFKHIKFQTLETLETGKHSNDQVIFSLYLSHKLQNNKSFLFWTFLRIWEVDQWITASAFFASCERWFILRIVLCFFPQTTSFWPEFQSFNQTSSYAWNSSLRSLPAQQQSHS